MPSSTQQQDPSASPAIHVVGDSLVGAQLTHVLQKLQVGAGNPDPADSKPGRADVRQIALHAQSVGSAGGLRNYLPDELGEGYWDLIEVAPGFFMSVTDALYKKPYRFTFPDEQLLKIRVICSGSISTSNTDVRTGDNTAHIQFAQIGANTSYVVHPGNRLQMVGIIIEPSAWGHFGLRQDMLPDELASLLDAVGDNAAVMPISSCTKLVRIAQEIVESRKTIDSEFRLTYVRGKSLELFCEAIGRVQPQVDLKLSSNRIRQSDISLLHEARHILNCSLEEPPTIEQLGRLVGINRTKLKSAFRDFFGETIHQYQTKVRMTEAERLLVETEMPIAEVAARVGFQHASNFTQAFKKHFSASPRQIRSQTN
ncbi:MAG: AraC family transcriptional regulator [Pseudomonadota bacterium]